MKSLDQIVAGQIFLVVCVVFYLIWWSMSYRPGEAVSRVGGLRGALLLITAVCGVIGIILSLTGVNGMKPAAGVSFKMSGTWILIIGVIAYFVLMAVTRLFFDRPVTTELFLMTGWAMLEVSVVNALNEAGILSDVRLYILLVVIAAASVIGLVLYVCYYRMEEWKAFYTAMVPLAADGAGMVILLLMAVL